jgi:hypothetical protein
MAGSVHCRCGELLVDEVTSAGVTPTGGAPIPFRRTTDYVVCPACHSVYQVDVLRGDRPVEDSLVGTAAEGESLVETLERLLESGGDPGDGR